MESVVVVVEAINGLGRPPAAPKARLPAAATCVKRPLPGQRRCGLHSSDGLHTPYQISGGATCTQQRGGLRGDSGCGQRHGLGDCGATASMEEKVSLQVPPIEITWALFTSISKSKFFQDFSSHKIFKHIHEILNIDKKK